MKALRSPIPRTAARPFLLRAILPVAAAFAASAAPQPAHAVPGGKLGTIAGGLWFCELPGDAASPALARPDENFSAIPDSSYVAPDGRRGTYLLLGDRLTMTSGPREGDRYVLESAGMLRKLLASGEAGPLRCIRAGDPGSPPPTPVQGSLSPAQ